MKARMDEFMDVMNRARSGDLTIEEKIIILLIMEMEANKGESNK